MIGLSQVGVRRDPDAGEFPTPPESRATVGPDGRIHQLSDESLHRQASGTLDPEDRVIEVDLSSPVSTARRLSASRVPEGELVVEAGQEGALAGGQAGRW